MTVRGRTNGDGSVTFYDDEDGSTVLALNGDGAAVAVGWTEVTGKPSVFPTTAANVTDATTTGRSVLTATDATAARTAIGAGTSSLALGTTASTAAPGNHTHSGLLTGSATAVNNSTATDVAGLVTDFNNLLAALRTRGIITGS